MFVALIELHPDETPEVILSEDQQVVEHEAAEMILSLWQNSPDVFEDDGPEYMKDYLDAADMGFTARDFIEGLREATTVPFVTVFEQAVIS